MNDTTMISRIITQLGSQAELARRLGMHDAQRSTVRWWLKKGYVPQRWIQQVAQVGGVPVAALLADVPAGKAPGPPRSAVKPRRRARPAV